MRFRRYLAAVAIASAANMAISVASLNARVVTTTYSGRVFGGFDLTGMFIQPQAQFSGEAFTASFRIDLSAPQNCFISRDRTDVSSSVQIFADFGCSSVLLDLTIANRSLSLGGRNVIAQSQFDDGLIESYSHSLSSRNFPTLGNVRTADVLLGGDGTGADFLSGPYWGSITTEEAMSASRLFGSFRFSHRGGASEIYQDTWGTFTPIAVTVDSGVPEPTTWAMIVAGFGFIGAAARFRRRPQGR